MGRVAESCLQDFNELIFFFMRNMGMKNFLTKTGFHVLLRKTIQYSNLQQTV